MIYEKTSGVINANINGIPQTVRQQLKAFKITDDESIKKFIDEMIEGRDIIIQAPVKDGTYIVTRQFIPTKVAVK